MIITQLQETLDKGLLIFNMLWEMKQLKGHESWSRGQLEQYQQHSWQELRKFALEHSPFYKRFYRGYENASLEQLPVLNKSMIMSNFDEFCTDPRINLHNVRAHIDTGNKGRYLDLYEVLTTSGSTGVPGIFLFNPKEWTTVLASFGRGREWAGMNIDITRRSPMAMVSTLHETHLSARIGKAIDTPFIPTQRFDSTSPPDNIVTGLNSQQPEVMVAYASMGNLLALQQLAGTLKIKPRIVFTTAEVLTPGMRLNAEKAWGKILYDQYAATETGDIAAECNKHHGLHISEDLVIVELVDENNKPVGPGEYSAKILVTVLFNRTQPLIRYEITDSVKLATAEDHSCGLPFRLIECVQGRQEDVLTMKSKDGKEVFVQPNVFHDVMDSFPTKGWQIRQHQNAIEVQVIGYVDEKLLKDRIIGSLEKQSVIMPEIIVRSVADIPRAKSGKTPLIIRYSL